MDMSQDLGKGGRDMRINQPVTQNENDDIREHELIVSKTDLKGRITYANEALCRISGFSERELLGAPHNIMRHPDMPRVAYAWMWDTLRRGRDWQAMVKNRCKNGDHYWVEANVYAQIDADGRTCGYHSTRRKPGRAQIAEAATLYASLCRSEGELEQRSRLSSEDVFTLYRNGPLYAGEEAHGR